MTLTQPTFLSFVFLDVPELSDHPGYLGTFQSLSGLEVHFDTYDYVEGGNNDTVHRLPGRMRYPNLVLSWGVVNYGELLRWFLATRDEAQRHDITITL
jgi:phage tail-like protein